MCRCSTTRAPAARAAASARQPKAGLRLCALTARAPVRRTAAATSSGARPPRSSATAARERPSVGAVALEQLDLLAQVLAHEPQEVLDRALLAARDAVAVVQEEDHGRGKANVPMP